MKLSCCVWALDYGKNGLLRFFRKRFGRVVSESLMLEAMAELGFQSVDIQPTMQRSESSRSALQSLGLNITCVSLSHFAPPEATFHTRDNNSVQALMDYLKDGIDHTATLGIDRAYVVPGKADDALTASDFAPHYAELAEYGQAKGVKIGIEHFPKTALPTIRETLEFIKFVGHANLYLLFDIGHAQISSEDPAEWLPQAGDRLCYVHLDDNDGIEDLHLPLTEGVQSRSDLEQLFRTLKTMHYDGPISLELHPRLSNPFQALQRGKTIVEEIAAQTGYSHR